MLHFILKSSPNVDVNLLGCFSKPLTVIGLILGVTFGHELARQLGYISDKGGIIDLTRLLVCYGIGMWAFGYPSERLDSTGIYGKVGGVIGTVIDFWIGLEMDSLLAACIGGITGLTIGRVGLNWLRQKLRPSAD